MIDRLFILLQYLLPHHWLSRLTGWLADNPTPWLKHGLVKLFAGHFKVDMSEALEPDLAGYETFNAFFTRPLREGARPIGDAIVSPADGAVSQIGLIQGEQIFQAKGQYFSAVELLGGDEARAAEFRQGRFATIYLSPKDYHRVHMPVAGKLRQSIYVPGDLFSVNQVTAENVPRLFSRNERLVTLWDTDNGPMAMVLVGAMIVAGIETVWAGQVAPPNQVQVVDYTAPPAPVSLEKGAEAGRFKLGSTVILLFPDDVMAWDNNLVANTPLRMGQTIASYTE